MQKLRVLHDALNEEALLWKLRQLQAKRVACVAKDDGNLQSTFSYPIARRKDVIVTAEALGASVTG